jgi:predicted RNA-binding protein with PIN domain
VDFSKPEDLEEACALCDEALLESYLSGAPVTEGNIRQLIAKRKVFPCCFGSALHLQGVEEFLQVLDTYAPTPERRTEFGAKVFKISRDPQGNRLTWLKLTGGSLKVRSPLGEEKVNQIRLYSGDKFTAVEQVAAGQVCAVTGLNRTYAGQGLGAEPQGSAPVVQSVMSYRVTSAQDPVKLLPMLRLLEEEEPELKVLWDEALKQMHLRVMGTVQLEVLRTLMRQRFSAEIQLEEPRILYQETITDTVEGVGHFEPLRHYAEVHLKLEPLPLGSGLVFDTVCPTDVLDMSFQSLVMGHLSEKTHRGVLTGSPITDMKITLLIGKAHLKHTEGGDFRQATYRAVRQGLMQAKSQLLEPWYSFELTLPTPQVGRAITDIRGMSGRFEAPETVGELSVLRGSVPASELGDYASELAAYTHGKGRLQVSLQGYEPCHNPEAVVEGLGYDPEADLDNTPDSVFCAHGAGFTVKWHQVKEYMHLESGLKNEKPQLLPQNMYADDRELEAILKREFGDVKTQLYCPAKTADPTEKLTIRPLKQQYLLVDGYNMIFAWQELRPLAEQDLDAARRRLQDLLSSYAGFKKHTVVLVFDGYKNKGSTGEKTVEGGLRVVYTAEGETADAYIQTLAAEVGRSYTLRVASSDSMIQLSSLGAGVLRVSARELEQEVLEAWQDMRKYY